MDVAYAKSARAARLPVWRADRSLGPRSSVIDLLKADVMREVTADGPRTPDIAKTALEKSAWTTKAAVGKSGLKIRFSSDRQLS